MPVAARLHAATSRFAFVRKFGIGNQSSVRHKNHRHASELDRARILELDQRIAAARQTETAKQTVTTLLNELLNGPLFANRISSTLSALETALTEFHHCPRNADEKVRQQYSNALAQACAPFIKANARPDTGQAAQIQKNIELEANRFLESNRLDRLGFWQFLNNQLPPHDSSEQCSAQKMALETFINAFPVTVRESGREHIELLKRLIDILPNLEHHQIAERNAQRRGVLTLEKALEHLSPDGAAEVTAYLMNYISILSTLHTQRAIRHAILPQELQKVNVTAGIAGIFGTLGVASFVGMGILVPVIPIPAVIAGAVIGGSYWMGIEKQVQGTALYMLKRQLLKLREKWGDVNEANKKRLIDSFASLRTNLPNLYATKKYTLSRFFHNSHIDPSTFKHADGRLLRFGQLSMRLHDQFVMPVKAKLRKAPVAKPELAGASPGTRQLINLLFEYHGQFAEHVRRNGGAQKNIDWGKLIGKLEAGDGRYANYIFSCFNRINELKEYRAPHTRLRILEQLMQMCQAMTDYDPIFLATFAQVAELAQANCSNNARQMFRNLWDTVVGEMAARGEGGLDAPAALLNLAHQEFRKESLHRATKNVLGASVGAHVEVENYLAVEIMLKESLGLQDTITGLAYQTTAFNSVTSENLDSIEKMARERIENRNDLIDFLMQYSPLTGRIKNAPEYGYATLMKQENDEIEKLEQAYFEAEDKALPDIGEPEPGAKTAFAEAAKAYQSAKKNAEAKVLRQCIEHLLEQHAEVTRINAPAPLRSTSLASLSDAGEAAAPMLDEFDPVGFIDFSKELLERFDLQSMEDTTAIPFGLDSELFSQFQRGINTIARDFDQNLPDRIHGIGVNQIFSTESEVNASTVPHAAMSALGMQHIEPGQTSNRSPISPDDLSGLNYRLVNNRGGGDCGPLALGAESEADIRQIRMNIAQGIQQRPETDAQRNYNAHLVASALSQTPETAYLTEILMYGRHSVPNSVYAQLVRIPGIYIGEDELTVYSQFGDNPPNIVMVDSDGTLARFQNGVRETITYDQDSKMQVLSAALASADIALYKTSNHWQRIVRSES